MRLYEEGLRRSCLWLQSIRGRADTGGKDYGVPRLYQKIRNGI